MDRFAPILILITLTITGYGQTRISGLVSDHDGNPLIGVNIFIKDSYNGASSNNEGQFEFTTDLSGSQVLIVSMIGFEQHEQEINCKGSDIKVDISLKPEFNSLKAVEITAGAMEASDEKRSVVFTPLDVVTTAGALGDIVGALNTLPGTAVNGSDGRLFVRGGDASETSIFFDGLKVNNAYGSSVSGIPTRTRFSPQLFKGTFFSTGGYSAEYGQALSSALVLNTIDMPLRNQTDIGIMTVGGSASHTKVFEKDAFTGTIGYINLTPYMGLVPQNLAWEKAPQSGNAELLYRHQFSKRSLVKVFYAHQRSDMQVYQPTPNPDYPEYLVGLKNRFNYINGSWKQAFGDNWVLNSGLSYSRNKDEIYLDTADIDQAENHLHGKARLKYLATERLQISGGAEYYFHDYQEGIAEFSREVDIPLSAFHSEAQYYFTGKLALRAGLRYETTDFDEHLMPRISAAYQVARDQQISLAYGDFWQNQQPNYLVIRNNMDQSHSRHYILNYQFANNDRTIRAEAFYKEYDQLLLLSGSGFDAAGSGYARGFDLFYRDRKSIINTDFWITYSFIDSKRHYGYFTSQVQPGFAPKHNASIVAKHWIQKLNSQVGASYSFNDGYTYDNPNIPGEQESKTNFYSNLSLNWSYLPRPNMIIHLSISNVLGSDNIFGYRFSQQPNTNGVYNSIPVAQTADRFFFIGFFFTLSDDKKANQLNNL